MSTFSKKILSWFAQHGRTDLPWQQDPTPYRVWVSEIMLQQTQVSTVIPYYQRFMTSFPTVQSLADASQDDVLHHWTGLGYYARARNLHKAAQSICQHYQGHFPADFDDIVALPGIGRSTAGAILALSMQQHYSILDGNVKRVLCRYHAVKGWYGQPKVMNQLWAIAEQYTPKKQVAEYTQAMMDLGATLCTRSKPKCPQCPIKKDCQALALETPTAFPEKKPKKAKPSKSTQFVIIQNAQQEILLQQRPDSGIWGGLWSFPEIAIDDNPVNWSQQQFQLSTTLQRELSSFDHVFTHFKLTIKPVLLSCESGKVANSHWYHPKQDIQLGFPAPVETLLTHIFPQYPTGIR